MTATAKIRYFLLYKSGYYLYRYKTSLKQYQPDVEWKKRTLEAGICEDNKHIPRVLNAGLIEGNHQFLHNGLKVRLGSYYGLGYTHLLHNNKGVHEPQEERVFQEVLKFMPEGARMIELGSFWAFYSMWFQKEVKGAVNYMVEPDYLNLIKGKTNFKLNGFFGKFIHAFVGQKVTLTRGQLPTITVDYFFEKNKLEKINILHSDIQGEELNMLKGSVNSLSSGLIDFLFISTHSDELHTQCANFLESFKYEIIASANVSQSYSVDGVLVAKRKGVPGPEFINVDCKC